MFDDLRGTLADLMPHTCNVWKFTETNNPTTGRLEKQSVLIQSVARCRLIAESANDSAKGQAPNRERTFNLMIETGLTITDNIYFSDFSGVGITEPTAKYRIDKESTVNPILEIDTSTYSGRTEIKHLKRIDGNI